jgi:sorbitol-specific phosphotransferase system component IIBC
LKPERWGSPLVQEKYQEEKACDKRHPYNNNNNNNNNNNVSVKGKVTLLQARCGQRVGRVIALLFHDLGTRRG